MNHNIYKEWILQQIMKEKTAWQIHLDKVRKQNPGKSLKECMSIAKTSYKK